ncbi:MAG TPA: efflux RND transporter periplasmic adaptor subunit [Gemmataceae bacterium]|nr:efflux RND transporter periplasmic adaptor subunit [Gemmataceae bacterium]
MGSKLAGVSRIAVLSFCIAAVVQAADAPNTAKYNGRVEPAEQAGIAARVAGMVDKINVDIGDRVKKGQVLIELSAPELKVEMDGAVGRLEQAQAEAMEAEAAVQAAKARKTEAEAVMESAQEVYKRSVAAPGAVPQSEVLEAQAQMKKAEAARDVAAAEVLQAQAGVKAAQAGIVIGQAALQQAQTRLDFTRITAPFDGFVARRTVDPGDLVGPPQQGQAAPLLTVMRDDTVRISFEVDEASASLVPIGAPAVIRAAALGDLVFRGKVTRTSGVVNPNTGTIRVVIDLPNPDGKLRPGMFVMVEVQKGEPEK